jgi:hypothetical protein
MAWERKFEARAMEVRDRELQYQKLMYYITVSLGFWEFWRRLHGHTQGPLECYLVPGFN